MVKLTNKKLAAIILAMLLCLTFTFGVVAESEGACCDEYETSVIFGKTITGYEYFACGNVATYFYRWCFCTNCQYYWQADDVEYLLCDAGGGCQYCGQ